MRRMEQLLNSGVALSPETALRASSSETFELGYNSNSCCALVSYALGSLCECLTILSLSRTVLLSRALSVSDSHRHSLSLTLR